MPARPRLTRASVANAVNPPTDPSRANVPYALEAKCELGSRASTTALIAIGTPAPADTPQARNRRGESRSTAWFRSRRARSRANVNPLANPRPPNIASESHSNGRNRIQPIGQPNATYVGSQTRLHKVPSTMALRIRRSIPDYRPRPTSLASRTDNSLCTRSHGRGAVCSCAHNAHTLSILPSPA